MSFKINFIDNKVIATFNKKVKEGVTKSAFIYIVENGNVKKLDHIIFDYTNTVEYLIPDGFLKDIQTFTRFSQTWNTSINVIIVASNENIKQAINKLIKNTGNLNLLWNYLLFETLEEANDWCRKVS